MSQDSWEKFGVKSQMRGGRGGGGGGGGGAREGGGMEAAEKEKREKGYVESRTK